MQFYRYWTRGNETIDTPDGGKLQVFSYGYSNDSLDDALRVAEERARANRQRWNQPKSQQYYGNNNPLREEIVHELATVDHQKVVISRNKYGSLILNTPNVFFADIDKPESSSAFEENPLESVVGFFQNLFGGGSEPSESPKKNGFESSVIQRIENVIEHSPETVVRLYRTSNGFRAMVMNETIPCDVAKSNRLLTAFGSDELYVSLCRSQDCYRARLTPKPWRCGLNQPPVSFPYFDEGQKEIFSQWLKQYDRRISEHATCALIGNFGNGAINEACQQIAELHDNYALNGDFPLA